MLLGGSSWLASTSCGGEATTAPLQPSFGTLFVPLSTTGPSGAAYELTGGVLSLTGSESLRLMLDGTSEEARLLSGPYSVTLLDGWQLERDVAGERRRVDAELRSPNPARVQIRQGETTSFTLRFRVEGGEVALGEAAPDGPAVGAAGASGVDSEGPDELEPDELEPDDDEPGDDDGAPDAPGAPDAGSTPAPEAICAGDGARCLDEIVAQASAVPALTLCIPARQLASPLGAVDVCAGVSCASGAPGCPVQANASSTTAELDETGLVRLDAIAELTPLDVPVTIPVPLFGSVDCPVRVSGALLAAADVQPESDAQGSVTGFGLSDIGTNLDELALELATNNGLCAALEPLLPELRAALEPELAAALADSLDDSFDELGAALACARCEAACAVQCVPRP